MSPWTISLKNIDDAVKALPLKLTCEGCGKLFSTTKNNPHKQKYCTAECGNDTRKRLRKATKNCVVCGKPFIPNQANHKYCSEVCSKTFVVKSGALTFFVPRNGQMYRRDHAQQSV